MTKSFDNVYSENYSKVLNFIKYKINNREDAEDITANVFVKLHKAFDTYDENKSVIQTWLFNIAKNAIIDYLRASKKAKDTKFIGDFMDDNGNEVIVVKDFVDPQTMFEQNEIMALVNNAINNLSAKYKTVANDFFINQLSYEEISKKHSLEIPAVKVRIWRIKDQLQAQLKGY
jgi:RNA polymerase sigma factor (sigma-70 family)